MYVCSGTCVAYLLPVYPFVPTARVAHAGPVDLASSELLSRCAKSVAVVDLGKYGVSSEEILHQVKVPCVEIVSIKRYPLWKYSSCTFYHQQKQRPKSRQGHSRGWGGGAR